MKDISNFLKKVLKGIGCVFLFQVFFIFILKFIPIRTTSLIIIRSVQYYLKEGKKLQIHHHWVPLDEICFDMKCMTIYGEDTNFLEHWGFDFENIKYAYIINKHEKKIVWGGSTITQQTAKNVFLYPNRTHLRKALEAEITILLELIWGKKRILEVYLNSAEMGENIYGVESCAELIFKRTALTLTPQQCAMIVSMLPYKKKDYYHPCSYCIDTYNSLLKRYDFFNKMMNKNSIDSLSSSKIESLVKTK